MKEFYFVADEQHFKNNIVGSRKHLHTEEDLRNELKQKAKDRPGKKFMGFKFIEYSICGVEPATFHAELDLDIYVPKTGASMGGCTTAIYNILRDEYAFTYEGRPVNIGGHVILHIQNAIPGDSLYAKISPLSGTWTVYSNTGAHYLYTIGN